MTTPSQQTVDSWVPVAVVNAANVLHAQFVEQDSKEGLTVLSRLIFDPRMRAVWQLLYSKKRADKNQSAEAFAYPAIVGNKSRAAFYRRCALRKRDETNEHEADEFEALARLEESLPDFPKSTAFHDQDYAVKRVFDYACRAAIDISPTYLSDIEAKLAKIGTVLTVLHEQQAGLEKVGLFGEVEMLGDCIDHLAELAELMTEKIGDDPMIITRKRGVPKLRTYVVALYGLIFPLFGTPLYGTLATIANVAFDCETVTGSMVRDWSVRRVGLSGRHRPD